MWNMKTKNRWDNKQIESQVKLNFYKYTFRQWLQEKDLIVKMMKIQKCYAHKNWNGIEKERKFRNTDRNWQTETKKEKEGDTERESRVGEECENDSFSPLLCGHLN